jgi:3-oxoacyl-[acyl-carrier protein] reductase
VAVSGRRTAPLEEVARELGDRGIVVRGDVSQPGESARIIDEVTTALGGLDVLVNNAGVYPSARWPRCRTPISRPRSRPM